MTKKDTILIVGAGIGGMQAALLLAEAGYKVHLLDSAPSLGGSMPLLDRTFPTNSCGLCFMSPDFPAYCPFIECERHPNIEISAYAEVGSLEGEAGDFRASILKKARYVDPERCTGCGDCALVCPVEVPRELGEGLEKRKAIFRPYPQAVPSAYLIDKEVCTECGECLKVCRAEAIDLGMEDGHLQLGVGAVILTPGFQPFPAELKGEFGYGRYPNVITGFQFERMLSLTSPSHGLPQRPSDGQPPKRIAFIQCVGSRDPSQGRGYCSSVCCMYATKQAILAKERTPESEITLFYIDLRTFGKGHDRYLERAKKGYSINYQRSMVSAVKQEPRNKNLFLSYVGEDGRPREEEFDLVVLSTGFVPPPGAKELAQRVGIALNEYDFCKTAEFAPTETSRPGIFVAGAFAEPKDIAETVAEAASAAANAASLLGREAIEVELPEEYPPEREVVDEEPRVGLFLCRCGEEIAQAVDLSQLREFAPGLKEVALVQEVGYACRPEGLQEIKEAITGEGLNRVVVAGCTHRLYEASLQGALREAGLNPYLLERANLREECAWAHRNQPREATAKAKSLLEMAVAKARSLRPLKRATHQVTPGVLVLGGGLAGMTAALGLAEQGFQVYLVEKEKGLGGNLRHLYYTLRGSDPQLLLRSLVEKVESHPRIEVLKETEIISCQGSIGHFHSTLLTGHEESTVDHGAIIVATGGQEAKPIEYLYGQDRRVVTQRELEARLARNESLEELTTVVMIQCVGSREEGRPYCSQVCCSQAIKNALRIKEMRPEAKLFVFYRDMMTYGFREEYYRQAREAGVIFIPYEKKPRVRSGDDRLRVWAEDPLLKQELRLEADLLVLSPGIAPSDNGRLAQILGITLDDDGFFQEANPKVAPMDSGVAGIFLCGLAQGPKPISACISQANGAALKAASLLAKERLIVKSTVPSVNERLCSGCGLCVSLCPYDARRLNEETRVAEVIELLCQGCGLCAMACPNGATQQNLYEMRQVMAVMDAAL
jgi:heterodisulfide reductase subunit A